VTERLYYNDAYARAFDARVVETADDGRRVYLDRTTFYPSSGGQPFDVGTLGGVRVLDVVDEGDRIAHLLESPLSKVDVSGALDWNRRFDHMQQHTGQHLLSAVLVELFGAETVSFHMGSEVSTIDVAAPSLSDGQLARAEDRANELIFENRPVLISYADSQSDLGLRKASEREGTLRIVNIDNFDKSACGGTHVRSTGEIGLVLLRKTEKIRGTTRLEFVCGMRAVRRARMDYRALAQISRSFSAPIDETPALAAAQVEKAQDAEKARKRLAAELAEVRGRELYAATPESEGGLRKVIERTEIGEDQRIRAQSFIAGSKAVYLAVSETPPSILFAVSTDSGLHAGNLVKAAVTAAGGRGGGNANVAQGSVPDAAALPAIVAALGF
jgi:alanyl-tRNA synthetase